MPEHSRGRKVFVRFRETATIATRLGSRPFLFETSRPGIFTVGNVRAGSVKRIASAVGEGSVCIQLVHKVLAE